MHTFPCFKGYNVSSGTVGVEVVKEELGIGVCVGLGEMSTVVVCGEEVLL